MALEFYKPLYNPASAMTGQVGGAISTGRFHGVLGELFYHVAAPPSGVDEVAHQYRKVFIKNTYLTTITNVGVWIEATEHPEQLQVASETSPNQIILSPTGEPSGVSGSSWIQASGYRSALPVGSLAPAAVTGIWIRQSLSGIEQPDPYVFATLYVAGLVT